MSLTTLSVPNQNTAMAVGTELKTSPVYVYVNGKRTDEQKQDEQGRPLFTVRGLAPVVGGELVTDGSVQVTRSLPKPVPVQLGSTFTVVEGVFTVRAASGFGLTGTLRGTTLKEGGK